MSHKNTFTDASVSELWKLSIPLMISSFATFAMIFVDRMFLAKFSIDAHNACVAASTIAWGFTIGFQVLNEMVEIFVAQYNGAKKYHILGKPVWQTLWMCLISPRKISQRRLERHSTLQRRLKRRLRPAASCSLS